MPRRKGKCPAHSNAPARAGKSAESPAACRRTRPGRANCLESTSVGFREAAGTAGTVCGLENAVTCCMPGSKFSLNRGENQSHVRSFALMWLLACQAVALAKDGNRARNRLSKVDCDHEHEYEQETKYRHYAGRLRRDRAGDCRPRTEVSPSAEISRVQNYRQISELSARRANA